MKRRIHLYTAFVFATLLFAPGASLALEAALCPVCRVHEGETEAEPVVTSAEYQGTVYGFCSSNCRDTFLEAPESYLPPVLPRPAPSFTVQDLEGAKLELQKLRGRTVLLDFWATWCPPCVADLPKLSQLHERHAEKGLTVLSVSIDEGEKAGRKVARVVKKRKATHPIYLDTDSSAWAAYGVRVVPAQFLIDAAGNIVEQWSGVIDLERVESEIVRLMSSAPRE